MIVRLTVAGQETWHYDATRTTANGQYLVVECVGRPWKAFYYMPMTKALVCATPQAVTDALKEERRD